MKIFRRARQLMAVCVIAGIFLALTPTAQAGYWGEPTTAAIMKQTMETIARQIEGVLLGALKMAAVTMMNMQVQQVIGGGRSNRPMYITNFNDFLYMDPARRTEVYMNDFFTLTTRGRGSSANYIGVGDRGGVGGNYAAYLQSVGRSTTTEARINVYNLEEYSASPDVMFAEGDWRAFNAFFSNPANNPYGYSLQAERAYQSKLEEERQVAAVKAQSPGFLPVEKNGKVVTPAGAVRDMSGSVKSSSVNAITSAANPGELAGGSVLSFANKVIKELSMGSFGGENKNAWQTANADTQFTEATSNSWQEANQNIQYTDTPTFQVTPGTYEVVLPGGYAQ